MKNRIDGLVFAATLAVAAAAVRAAPPGRTPSPARAGARPAAPSSSPAPIQQGAPATPFTPGSNLLFNGSFDNPTNNLAGWRYVYDLPGEGAYANNHELVSVVTQEGGHMNVLKLWGRTQGVVDVQGVQVDSKPVPFDKNAAYKLTVSTRTTGPNCRILLEGYKWKPGIRPHVDPVVPELRKCYRFEQVFFGAQGGEMGNPKTEWSTASMTLPREKMTELQKQMYDDIKFLVVHVIAIGGKAGILYVDDVKIERTR